MIFILKNKMSDIVDLKNKSEEKNISLNSKTPESSSNNIIKEQEENNIEKEEEIPQKKSDIHFPSSTIETHNSINSDLLKNDKIKLNQIIPDYMNNNTNNNNESNKFNFFQSKKINSTDTKDNNKEIISDNKTCFCNCTKTRCIKKYCECFANNKYCKDCHCINCMNIAEISCIDMQKESIEEKIFCTCSKSNCKKKYCDCYKSSIKCTDKCRCVNCKNSLMPSFNVEYSSNKTNESNLNIINNDNNNLNDKDNISSNINNSINNEKDEKDSSYSKNNNNKDSNYSSNCDEYLIQRVSIFICNTQTVINVEKFTKEMMLINKKRKRGKK